MQIPHWAAPAATNAAWSGCGSSGVPRPRTVVTARPSAWTASARHELMARPSSSTAQAPQSPRSHPDLTSVAARRCRRTPSRVSWASTVARTGAPFSVNSIARTGLRRRPEAPGDQGLDHRPAVLGAPAHVADGTRGGGRRRRGRRDRGGVQRRAHEPRLGLPGPEGARPDRAQRDPGLDDPPRAVELDPRRDAHDRDRAAALEPELDPALPAAVARDAHRADQLARPDRRLAGPDEEGVERERPLAGRTGQDEGGVEREERDREIGPGAGVGEVPPEGRLVAGEEIGEVVRGGPERRQARPHARVGEELAHRGPGPEPERAVLDRDPPELREPADVDQEPRVLPALAEVDEQVGAA